MRCDVVSSEGFIPCTVGRDKPDEKPTLVEQERRAVGSHSKGAGAVLAIDLHDFLPRHVWLLNRLHIWALWKVRIVIHSFCLLLLLSLLYHREQQKETTQKHYFCTFLATKKAPDKQGLFVICRNASSTPSPAYI